MKTVLLEISKCDQCPFFYNEYYDYEEWCNKLYRVIEADDDCEHPIPYDCPLTDVSGSSKPSA